MSAASDNRACPVVHGPTGFQVSIHEGKRQEIIDRVAQLRQTAYLASRNNFRMPATKERAGNRGGRGEKAGRDSRWPVTGYGNAGTRSRAIPARRQTADRVLIHTDTELEAKKTCSTTGWPALPSRAAHTTRKWAVIAVSPRGQNNQRKDFQTFPRCASACCFASSRCGW